MSLSESMIVSRSGILAHQQRLETIAHNIANIDTEGYRRQKVDLETNPPKLSLLSESRDYTIGAGVTVADIVRTYDQMKEGLLHDKTSELGSNEQRSAALGEIEVLVTGIGDASLSGLLQGFWDSWQDVANNAESLAYRSVLLERTEAMTDYLGNMSEMLGDYRSGIVSGVGAAATGAAAIIVNDVNALAQEIQNLNDLLTRSSFGDSNDLMDKRDVMVRSLSEMVDINVASDFEITIDGEILVNSSGAVANQLSITSDLDPVTFDLNGNAVNITGGTLGGWVNTSDGVISEVDSMITVMDNISSALLNNVNAIHGAGSAYDLNGDVGIDFFTLDVSGDLVLNFTDPELIAAAATTNGSGDPNQSDGASALGIAQLAHDDTIALLNSQTFDEYYNTALTGLGAEIDACNDAVLSSQAVMEMIKDAILSESGVNLDEEMIDMMSAQRAYEASARVMQTVDEMMDLVINRLKR